MIEDNEFARLLEKTRRASARRRSEAWAAVPEIVLGLPIRPITPATDALLHATGNAFVCGLPPVESDVKNFLLFHSFEFNTDDPAPRFWLRFRLNLRHEAALCPLTTKPRRRASVRAERFLQAVREIRAIVEATWADSLPANEEADAGPSVAAARHAQLADMFAREYHHWPMPRPFRHTPLAQLFQMARCIERGNMGKEAGYYDPAEAALVRDFLADANAPRLAAERAKQIATD
jgi:hypothetical protein